MHSYCFWYIYEFKVGVLLKTTLQWMFSWAMADENFKVCGECEDSFVKYVDLKNHMFNHLYQCVHCKKRLTNRRFLERHKKITLKKTIPLCWLWL